MKLLSPNRRGVASPFRKSALQRLEESNQPDLILIQETMGEEALVIPFMEALLKQWKFIGANARGRSGKLARVWNTRTVNLQNS
jgi:exonuclease III